MIAFTGWAKCSWRRRRYLLPLTHHDEVHVALVAEGAHKLRVLGVLAVLGEAAQPGGSAVQHLGAPAAFRHHIVDAHFGGQQVRTTLVTGCPPRSESLPGTYLRKLGCPG